VGFPCRPCASCPLSYDAPREQTGVPGFQLSHDAVDPTSPVILLVVVAAAVLSVIAIVALLATVKQIGPAERAGHILLASLTIADS
jgi:uncharacterized membrane protein